MKRFGNIIIMALIISLWGAAKWRVAALSEMSGKKLKSLYLFSMSDYFPAEVLDSFTHKTGCMVKYDTYSSNEELVAKLQGGATGYDIIVPSDYVVASLINGGYLQKLDRELIPNFKYVHPDFIGKEFDPKFEFVAPYTWGTTGFIVNTQKTGRPLQSWKEVFSEEFKGRISLLDDEREVIGSMLFMLGHSPNSQNPAELKEAQKLMISFKPLVKLFASDPKENLRSGNLWISHIYSGDAEQIVQTNPEFQYFLPSEGVLGWIDTLAIPKGSKNPECAHAFINHILSPEMALITTQSLRYSSPNVTIESVDVDNHLKPSFMRTMPAKKVEFLTELGETATLWSQLWTEIKSN